MKYEGFSEDWELFWTVRVQTILGWVVVGRVFAWNRELAERAAIGFAPLVGEARLSTSFP